MHFCLVIYSPIMQNFDVELEPRITWVSTVYLDLLLIIGQIICATVSDQLNVASLWIAFKINCIG